MNWTIRDPPSDKHDDINRFLENNIIGFRAINARVLEQTGRREAMPLLPRNMAGAAYPSIWRAAYLHSVILAGAINSTSPYEMAIDVANTGNVNHARGFAKERRIISGIAVRKDMRGQGIGKALLQANETAARQQGAGVIVGFMDDANGSPRIYKSAGYTVMPHNMPVPFHAGKFGLNELHNSGLDGHWFYKHI